MAAEEHEMSGRGDRLATENPSVSIERSVTESVIVIESDSEDRDLGPASSEFRSTHQVENQSHDYPSDSSARVLAETRIDVNSSDDNSLVNSKVGEIGLSKVSAKESKMKICGAEINSRVIDLSCASVKSYGDNGESVCRICHLSSDQSPDRKSSGTSVSDLIQLGCGCKDDLGITHYQCAEAWFKLKGNRVCEICGETAKNVTGVGDVRFMEEWNDGFALGDTNSLENRRGCWRGQPFCNFLMACLVIAFVLPWFFRVNMF